MPLVEIISALTTDEATADTVFDYAKNTLGKTAVRAGDRAGFIVNALLIPYLCSAVRMLESGYATKEDIDAAMKGGCGYPMGPLTSSTPSASTSPSTPRSRCTTSSPSRTTHPRHCCAAWSTRVAWVARPARLLQLQVGLTRTPLPFLLGTAGASAHPDSREVRNNSSGLATRPATAGVANLHYVLRTSRTTDAPLEVARRSAPAP